MQKIWLLLLDDEFIEAWKSGILVKCGDGILRRIFPRVFTYSPYYPEKYVPRTLMLIMRYSLRPCRYLFACIRFLERCPCPDCLVAKDQIDKLGQVRDMKTRVTKQRNDTHALQVTLRNARQAVFNQGYAPDGKAIDEMLRSKGYTVTRVRRGFNDTASER